MLKLARRGRYQAAIAALSDARSTAARAALARLQDEAEAQWGAAPARPSPASPAAYHRSRTRRAPREAPERRDRGLRAIRRVDLLLVALQQVEGYEPALRHPIGSEGYDSEERWRVARASTLMNRIARLNRFAPGR